MTPCSSCYGLCCCICVDCLEALDECVCAEQPPECPACGETRCESERVCATCRREGAELARVVLPALDELMWRRRLNAEPRTVPTRPLVHGPQASILGDVYTAVRTTGTLAALGLALGSLAPLVRALGGLS